FAEADAAHDNPTREFHIVGGLHPKLRLAYYLDMFRGLKQRHPGVHIKALTAVEVAHLARLERLPVREVLAAMRDAGVTSLPGGGAEVFSPAARATIADKKLSGDEWLAVHREAHRLGIPSNCTMLYGHVETMADRVDHLLALRASLYQPVRTFEDWVPGRATARPEGPAGPSFKIEHRRAAAAPGGRGGRVLPVLASVVAELE